MVHLLRQDRKYDEADDRAYGVRLTAKMVLRNLVSRAPGEAGLRKSLSLARKEASAGFLVLGS